MGGGERKEERKKGIGGDGEKEKIEEKIRERGDEE